VNGRLHLRFTPVTSGAVETYVFTYRAVDPDGAQSATAATVTAVIRPANPAQTLNITLASYRWSVDRIRVVFTTTVQPPNGFELYYVAPNGTQTLIPVAPVFDPVLGTWTFDTRPANLVNLVTNNGVLRPGNHQVRVVAKTALEGTIIVSAVSALNARF
jgi:hypothetical protein